MQCAGQVEIDGFCNQVLEKHWPHVKRLQDIREVKGDEFGTVELICGGFPCQPFSTAGKRRGHADDRYLWPEMLRVIQASRPRWVCGENVAGIVSMALDTVLSDLEASGYACQSLIIPACAVDAPHRRDRVWIVGHCIEQGLEGLAGDGSSSNEPGRVATETVGSIGPSSVCEALANTQGHAERPGLCDSGSPTIGRREFGNGGADVADTERRRCSAKFSVGPGAIWEPEPDVGGTIDGLSRWLDGLDMTISHKLYLTYAKETNQRPGEVLRALRDPILSQGIQWPVGRSECFSASQVLLAYLCKLETQAVDKAWLQLESKEALKNVLRGLLVKDEFAGSPYQPKTKREQSREHPDTLQTLSRFLAYDSQKAFLEYRRTYAGNSSSWSNGWENGIDRVATNVSGRVDRLRALGNAVVPQVVTEIGRAIMQAERRDDSQNAT